MGNVPYNVQDAVEMWARGQGRHGKVVDRRPRVGCFVIELDYSPDAPILELWRNGTLRQPAPPKETVMLQRWNPKLDPPAFEPMDLEEYGADGIVSFLEQGNVWSGRGEYNSLEDAVHASITRNTDLKKQMSDAAFEDGKEIGWLTRRSAHELPMVAGSDIPSTPSSESLTTPT